MVLTMNEVKSKIGGVGDEEQAKAAHLFMKLAQAFELLGGIQQTPMCTEPAEAFKQYEEDASEGEYQIEQTARMIYFALTGKKPRPLEKEEQEKREEGYPIFMGAGDHSLAEMGAIFLCLSDAINKLMIQAMPTAPKAAASIYKSLTGVEPKFKT